MKLLFSLIALLLLSFQTVRSDTDDINNGFTTDYNSTGIYDMNQTYTPRPFVQAFHACPHVGANGKLIQEPKFFYTPSEKILEKRHAHLDEGDEDQKDAYINSLLFFPISLGCCGLLAIVLLDLGIDGYFSPWLVPHLGPIEVDPDEDTITSRALVVHANETSRKNWLAYYCISVFIALFATNFVFFGNNQFDVGYNLFRDSINDIGDDLFTLSSGVQLLYTQLQDCSDLVDQAVASTCPEAAAAQPLVINLNSQLHAYDSQLQVIGNYVRDVNDEILRKMTQKDIYIYTIYALSMAMIIVLIVISFFTNASYMKYTVYAAQFSIVVLIGQSSFYVFCMMFFSDFCMDPMTSVYESMNGLGLIQQTAKHYGSCKGLNPIHRNLAESYAIRDVLGTFLVNLFDYQTNPACECRSDRTTIDSFRALQSMHTVYESLATLMDCPTVHFKWLNIYDEALCETTITGLAALWINGWFSCLSMFLIAISASVLMLYFDEAWNQVENNRKIVDERRAAHSHSAKYAEISSGTDKSEVSADDTGSDSDSDSNVRV